MQVDYAVALTLAVMGRTLPARVAKELTGLLHNMVWLLAEFVKERALRRTETGDGPEFCCCGWGSISPHTSLFLAIACGTAI